MGGGGGGYPATPTCTLSCLSHVHQTHIQPGTNGVCAQVVVKVLKVVLFYRTKELERDVSQFYYVFTHANLRGSFNKTLLPNKVVFALMVPHKDVLF